MPNYLNQDTGTIPDPTDDQVPAYLQGADLHNIGNSNSSWFDPSTWGDRAENGLKFGAVSVLSGAAQLYNSGVAIGGFAGLGDGQTEDIQNIVTGVDSDLGEYYSQNRQAADLVGFMASSFVPGLAGIKVLNAGQHVLQGAIDTGMIGGNLAKYTGLLVPKTATYIAGAAQDINAASATFSAITQNGIKALASGVVQQTLEGAAFETMVQATMFTSPILDEQTPGDIIKNIVLGGALGGVIGGAFEGASTYAKIMDNVKGFESEAKFASARALQQDLNSPSINIIRNAQDIETAATPIPPTAGASPEEVAIYNKLVSDAEQRTVRAYNDMRTNVNALAKGSDNTATNMVADAFKGQSSDDVMGSILHADEVVRPGVMTSVEREQNALAKLGKDTDPSLQTQYVKLTGEDTGAVTAGEPAVFNIADTAGISKNGSLADAVMDKVSGFKFKLGQLWDADSMVGTTAHTQAEARYIWADRLQKLPDDLTIHQNDIPLLEKSYQLGKLDVNLADNTGQVTQKGFQSRDEMWKYITETKENVANSLMGRRGFGGEEYDATAGGIAKIVNTKLSRLDGTVIGNPVDDYQAWQSANKDYKEYKLSKQLPYDPIKDDTRFLPSYAKISRRVPDMSDADGHVLDGATWIKTQEKLSQDAIDNVVAKATGDLNASIPTFTEQQLWSANRGGAGAKMAGFATGGYGSFESAVQGYGAITAKLKTAFRQTTSDTLQGPLAALARNQEAAIEFSTVNAKVTRSAKQWVRYTADDGTEHLISKDAQKLMSDAKEPTAFEDLDPSDVIGLTNKETSVAIDAMIARSSARQQTYAELRAAQGKVDAKDPTTYRPIRPNPKDYPSFAFVKDDKVVDQGHTTMIFAKDANTLQQMGNKAEQLGYRVHYKQDTDEYFKAYGDYEYQRTLNESYIDSALKNNGIYSETFAKTDPQKIVNDIIQQHLREDDVQAMELMRAKNQKGFDFLEDQGKAYSRIESSTLGKTSIARLEASGKNPYTDYIKTALDVSKAPEATMLNGFNKMLDETVSKAVGSVKTAWAATRTPYDAEKINGLLDKFGMNTGYRDAALDLLANHTAPRGELTKFIRNVNGIMSTFLLGLDPLHALTNAIGSNVLRGTELSQLTDAINSGNTKLGGQLAKLAKIDVTGKGDMILSPLKLIAQAHTNMMEDGWKGGGALMKRYKDAGYVTGDISKFYGMLDDAALKGTETVSNLQSRLGSMFQKAKELSEAGKKYTGNKFAEEYNRFISADVMRQITDLGEQHGLLTRQESHSYINTFVNRVDGNITATQRPLMFQGPVGSAIGLFQSYQFNAMQNMFRYSAEGKAKDLAMLGGLQSTFFGINGLPGYQFINQHIVGSLSGNKNHTDLYDATYGAAGKQAGDLLMYGLPSDLLRTNIYSRADLNPRSLTLIPTALKDVPIVGGITKLLGSIKDTTGKIANGAPVWQSFLQGLEHQGLSRPLAGIAQTLEATGPGGQAFATNSKNSILFSNDVMSLATLSRLAGGRPLDEAIVNDGVNRIHAYQQADHDKLNALSEAVKTSSMSGLTPDGQQMGQFASEYAASGGKQQNFNKWVLNEMKNANTNEAQKITRQLQNPFAQKVQVLMGGDPYAD